MSGGYIVLTLTGETKLDSSNNMYVELSPSEIENIISSRNKPVLLQSKIKVPGQNTSDDDPSVVLTSSFLSTISLVNSKGELSYLSATAFAQITTDTKLILLEVFVSESGSSGHVKLLSF